VTTTRFAPSPTGRLHLGHAWSAVLGRRLGSRWLLRIEDLDPGRARPEFVQGILEDLAWLGLDHDGEPIVQSQRTHLYAEALQWLQAEGLVYPCFCTRADIAASPSATRRRPWPKCGVPAWMAVRWGRISLRASCHLASG
jgi:glutamyl-Q tRNA(Asp) synthetase